MRRSPFVSALIIAPLLVTAVLAAETPLDAKLHHLRSGTVREWADFPADAEGPALTLRFHAKVNRAECALRLRQQDVKQPWRVLLNGKELGKLAVDENDTVIFLAVPAGRLVDGENTLKVEATGKVSDDIRVGEIALDDRPLNQVLNEATVEIAVFEEKALIPSRITVLTSDGALMTTGAKSTERLAVRPGVIYTADGKARFGLPAGTYTIVAGRGFEYGIDRRRITLKPGDAARESLTIRREVPTPGYASCDTHVHTLTHSGHGDATEVERVITIAGEGLELPVATEHNKQVDYHAAAVKAGLRGYFTPIVGNEVTTPVGHFNIFPVKAGGPVPDHKVKDWAGLFKEIEDRTRARAMVLNHPRDVHLGFRPFGADRHIAVTGENLDGWELRANAMEVVNSGAQQTDVMSPFRDWFGLLNRGVCLTPVGASDSHDVNRYIVGQARTYIRCKDDKPGEIDVDEVVKNFRDGRVLVSCGLLAEITVNDKYGPGDLVPAGELKVSVRVLGPSWTTADRVKLYANGIAVREDSIADGNKAGVKWSGEWTLPKPRHDVHLVAVATGPGVTDLYWPIAKPYQPTDIAVRKRVIGCTGAVWVDADGDGQRTCAFVYAKRIHKESGGKWRDMIKALSDYDEAVAAQAASLLQADGIDPDVAAKSATRPRRPATTSRVPSTHIGTPGEQARSPGAKRSEGRLRPARGMAEGAYGSARTVEIFDRNRRSTSSCSRLATAATDSGSSFAILFANVTTFR